VRINSRQMMVPLVHLLADEHEQARSTAASALAASGRDDAALLLRLKILSGDKEPAVVGECLTAFLRLTRSTELIETFLDSPDDETREMAILALAESRQPAAADLLIARLARELSPERRRPMLEALAMNRQPAAIDYLLNVVREGGGNAKQAIAAMEIFKPDAALRAKMEAAMRESGLL
jgi:HEAT repeat protein